MDELGFDFNNAVAWFLHQQEQPYALVKLTAEQTEQLVSDTATAVRRCYISDQLLIEASAASGLAQSEVLASRLPDPGSTMAGDFGEILGYFYQSTKALPEFAVGVKKWRLKQDRTKPAPKSDVVHFLMPDRFINLIDHPPISTRFHAVAVVCESLIERELVAAPDTQSTDFTLLVIVVPNLKQNYESIFNALHETLEE